MTLHLINLKYYLCWVIKGSANLYILHEKRNHEKLHNIQILIHKWQNKTGGTCSKNKTLASVGNLESQRGCIHGKKSQ